MKKINSLVGLAVATLILASCGSNAGYKKTKSGLLYKIITSGKDSLVKEGAMMKFNIEFRRERGDSVIQTSYGKMPGYAKITLLPPNETPYNISELFPLMHANDSLVSVQFIDSMVAKGLMPQMPPFLKKGDKVITTFKVIKIFSSDSLFAADREAEMVKDRPRAEAEEKKQREKMMEEQAKAMAQMKKEADDDLKTQVPELEKWLASKNIKAQKTGSGTFVVITNPGTGPLADSGMYASVRYSGKLKDGKQFESNMDQPSGYPVQVGTGAVIRGWDEGLKLFRKGGRGTLYVPGALAYGRNPRPGSPFGPNETLIFDIAVDEVSSTPLPPPGQPQQPQQQQPQPKKK